MSEYRKGYSAQVEPVDPAWAAKFASMRVTDAEMRLILRLRQAAGQGRLVVVDPDAMVWYLCGPQERGGK